MKNIKLIYILLIFIGLISCKAQQTVASLYDMEQCRKRPNKSEECPGFGDVNYVKDIGNRLNIFTGTWKGTYNGKQIELRLEKKTEFENYGIKWDQLNGKLKMKDSQGNIIFDSFSNPDKEANPYGYNFQGSSYEMGFMANGDCFDEGMIFIEMRPQVPNAPAQMTFLFARGTGFETGQDLSVICPNYATYQTLLPDKVKIILTKQ